MAVTNTFRVRCTGVRPLMMSSSAGVAPRGEKGARLKELNGKRKPTLADEEERRRLKFEFALYWNEEIGVYLPGHNLWAAGKAAAKKHRLGELWKQGVIVLEEKLPLIYEGPRTPAELYADNRFVDTRIAVLNGKQRIEAIRPIFPNWAVEATFIVDDEFMNPADVQRALTIAGPAMGLGTYRERFGRFETSFPVAMKKAA